MSLGNENQTDGEMVMYIRGLSRRNFLVIWLIVKNKFNFRVELRSSETFTALS